MTKQTEVVGFIHAVEQYTGEYMYAVYGCDMSSCGYIPVAQATFPVPDMTVDQIKARHIVLLRLERDQVYEKARKEAAELDEKIARLESIGYTPADKSATPTEPF
jgi:hypothetical protein